MTLRADRRLMAVVLLALIVRVLMVAGSPEFKPAYDAADYDRLGASIAAGAGYPATTYAAPGTPSAFRPPAWPYALAAAYRITGQRWQAGRLLGAGLGTLSVLLLALVGRELWGRRVGLTAGALAAIFPPLVYLDASLLSETLFVAMMLGAVWALLRARRSPRVWPWIAAAGALAGVAAMTRTAGLLLLAPVGVASWAAARAAGATRRRAVLGPVLALLAAVALVAPWTARNLEAFGSFVPVSTQGGYALVGTYNDVASRDDEFQGTGRVPTDLPELRPIFARPAQDEAALDRRLSGVARRFARAHPGYVLEAGRLNTLRLADLAGDGRLTGLSYTEMSMPSGAWVAVSVSAWIVLALAVAGAIVLARRSRARGPRWLWAIPLLLWLSVVPIAGAPRYRAVLDPFLLLLAAVAVVWWRARREPRMSHSSA